MAQSPGCAAQSRLITKQDGAAAGFSLLFDRGQDSAEGLKRHQHNRRFVKPLATGQTGANSTAKAPLKPAPVLNGPGLQTLLQTTDFGAWEQVISGSLGHHRSHMLPNSTPFAAHIRGGRVGEFSLLHLQGRGQVELLREQCGHGVLWLPLQGWSHERINGQEHLAEAGMGLLFRPGDVLQGVTSEQISGVSILLPAHTLPEVPASTPLLHQGPAARRLIDAGWQLAQAAAHATAGARFAAESMVEALQQWGLSTSAAKNERITAAQRRRTVNDACLWMQDHLTQRFSVLELSQTLNVSVRSLQYSFQTELGCTPMAQAKRLRLRRLRKLLQNSDLASSSIAELMEASGLLACGATSADYRLWCGESPRRTRHLHGQRQAARSSTL